MCIKKPSKPIAIVGNCHRSKVQRQYQRTNSSLPYKDEEPPLDLTLFMFSLLLVRYSSTRTIPIFELTYQLFNLDVL
jgi:hypothetical protein